MYTDRKMGAIFDNRKFWKQNWGVPESIPNSELKLGGRENMTQNFKAAHWSLEIFLAGTLPRIAQR